MTIPSTPIKRGIALVTAALVVGSLAACTDAPGAAVDKTTLTIAYDSDSAAQGYDPLRYGVGQGLMFEGLYDTLAEQQPDGSVKPGIATEFVYSEDGTQITLTLAEGVEFTDGSTLNAELVKANLDRRSNPELVAYGVFAPGGAAEITSVDVIDDTHVQLTFVAPQQGFETNLTSVAGMIVGQDAIDDVDSLGTTPDGSGPYVLDESTVKGSSYVLKKKDEHAELDNFAYETIIFKPITDTQARTNAVISGQADTGFIATSTASLAEDKGLKLSQVGGTVVSMLVFDKSGVTNEAFADPNVRIALGYAIDREELVSGLHAGDLPAVNALPAANPGFSKELDTEYGYNPEKAKELLADAGYADGFEFTIIASADTQTDMEALQKYFAAVGVTMEIKLASSTEEAFAAVNTTPLGLLPLNWGNPVGTMFGVILGFANSHGEVNPELIGATQAVAGAQSDEDRAGALAGLNEGLVTSGWLIPVYEQLTTWTYNDEATAPVTFPGQSNIPLLSSFKPAA